MINRKLWIAAAESSEIYLKSLNEHDQYCNFVLITSVYCLPSSSYFSVSNPISTILYQRHEVETLYCQPMVFTNFRFYQIDNFIINQFLMEPGLSLTKSWNIYKVKYFPRDTERPIHIYIYIFFWNILSLSNNLSDISSYFSFLWN